MRNPLISSIVALAIVTLPPFVSAQDYCDKQFVISQVRLPASTRLSQSEQAAINSDLVGRCLDDGQLGELVGLVRDKLRSLGYLRATVSQPSITIANASRRPQSVLLDLEVMEGARYKVREVQWWNAKAFSVEQLTSVSQVHVDATFDMSKVRETEETLRRLYAANGYTRALIVPEIQVEEAGHAVTVIFNVSEGMQSP